jgi:type IX secretion system PorP/SprF family membrane protein
MKTLKEKIAVLALALGSLTAAAQQAPMYTHYMYNTLEVNPAYAGSRDALTVTALNRAQWVDFKGAPLTQTITMHAPIADEHIGLGLSLMNDKLGATNNSSVAADFAFIMKMSEKSKLALGLSAGINMFKANLSSLTLDQQIDPSFSNNISKHLSPNFGFGAYYYRERFYAGISAPSLLENSYSVANQISNTTTVVGKEQRHYYFITGAMFSLSENLDFKPTGFVKVTSGAPVQADLTASFIVAKRLLLGAMFRTGDAAGVLLGYDLTQQFHLGYSFDWSYGLQTGKYNMGSHEIVLRYDFIFSSKKQIHSPRNF